MKRTILTLALGLAVNLTGSLAHAQWGYFGSSDNLSRAIEAINESVGFDWGYASGGYQYDDGNGYNTTFVNNNVVTTISRGNDGSSSAAITNYNDEGQAQNSTFYNSSGSDIGAALYNNGVMTTYNACGQEGTPGEACTWTNDETGEEVRIGW